MQFLLAVKLLCVGSNLFIPSVYPRFQPSPAHSFSSSFFSNAGIKIHFWTDLTLANLLPKFVFDTSKMEGSREEVVLRTY